MKVFAPRVPQYDPPDLEQQWIECTEAMIKHHKKHPLWKSQIEACQIGLQSFAANGSRKASDLLIQLSELRPKNP